MSSSTKDNDLIGSISKDLQRTFRQELQKFIKDHKKELSILTFVINALIGMYAILEQYDLVGIGIAIATATVSLLIIVIYLVMRKKNINTLDDLFSYAQKHKTDVDRLLTDIDVIMSNCKEKDSIIDAMQHEIGQLKTDVNATMRNYNDLHNYIAEARTGNERLESFLEKRLQRQSLAGSSRGGSNE